MSAIYQRPFRAIHKQQSLPPNYFGKQALQPICSARWLQPFEAVPQLPMSLFYLWGHTSESTANDFPDTSSYRPTL